MEEEETKEQNAVDPPEDIVYVKERPAVKILVGGTVIVLAILAFLWTVGFAMSFTDHRPPNFDGQIVKDQWDKTMGKKATSFDDCVEKGGSIKESFPASCDLAGETFDQSLTDACANYPENCLPEEPTNESESKAREAGKVAGETFKEARKAGEEFLDGFKEELHVLE